MSLHVLADENIPSVEHYLGALGTVQRFSGRELKSAQLAGVDALLVRSVTRVDATLLDSLPDTNRLRFVGTATSGVDHIDQDYLHRRGIGFSHAPGSNANSVVEYVLAAIAARDNYLERLFAGGCVGIIGYGVIGRAVAGRLRALGFACKVYDPWLALEQADQAVSLPDILACDIITLHAELTRAQPWPSYHLLDAPALAQIPRASLLINASRGSVVDNRALTALLNKGRGPQVVLDVWEGEPAISAALLSLVQLGTPHIAGYSLDGKLLATRMLVEAMTLVLALPWRDPGSAAGEAPPLKVDAGPGAAELLRRLLSQRYDIRADDAALREATLKASAEVPAGFDRLRRTYPPRRELLGSRVRSGPADADVNGLLRAMGCIVEGNGR